MTYAAEAVRRRHGDALERLPDRRGWPSAAAQPGQRIDRVDLLPPRERDWLVRGVNDTAAPYPATESLHRLFEAEAAARP